MQRETKGGKFSLHSQSIQLVCQQFLANVETIKQLRPGNLRHRFPYRHKKYRTVQWPAQAVVRRGTRQVVDFCRAEGVRTLYVGDPHGVRNENKGRHHNQRMRKSGIRQGQAVSPGEVCTRWHRVLQQKSSEEPAVAVHDATGRKSRKAEIGPGLRCGFVGHRDIVGSMNMHPLA